MTELFDGKYRVPTVRAKWNGYNNGVYFVTICTQGKRHWFGEIRDGAMQYTDIGRAALESMSSIPSHCPYADVAACVVMPNHVHMIVSIDGNKTPQPVEPFHETAHDDGAIYSERQIPPKGIKTPQPVEPFHETAHDDGAIYSERQIPPKGIRIVDKETFHETSLQERQTWLSVVVRQYKSSVTRLAKKQGIPFAWQTRYYDHIIRDQQSYETITNYISDNVSTWTIDKMYT